MTCAEIISKLQANASEKYKANVIKLGIPAEHSIGVSTAFLRDLAKKIGKSHSLALELWATGYHEAKLLAVLLFDKKAVTPELIERLMSDVHSWDLCDHVCKNLILRLKHYDDFIVSWISSAQTYKKRAAFTLIASSVIHNKKITDDVLDQYLQLIHDFSESEHEHIKKAASWALREIGKKNFDYNEKAILLACEFMEHGNKAQQWIARDTRKELEKLVKADGRSRLISRDTQMGKMHSFFPPEQTAPPGQTPSASAP